MLHMEVRLAIDRSFSIHTPRAVDVLHDLDSLMTRLSVAVKLIPFASCIRRDRLKPRV